MAKLSEDEEIGRRAAARVATVANSMGDHLTELARTLHTELAETIPELQGDPLILELLRASTESNVETFLHVAQYDIAVDDVTAPSAAVEYARRLAQRGTSSNALLRAYRMGHRRVLDWFVTEIAREEPDGQVALAAARLLQDLAFRYVDTVSEQVVAEYEAERERWLVNRNTVRASMLTSLLAGESVDLAAGESALGYRLRQNHLGVVVWASDRSSSANQLRQLEHLLACVAKAAGASGQPLFIPQDRSLGWGWVPLGRSARPLDLTALDQLVERAGPTLHLALGTPGATATGFRVTHLEAQRAYHVATVALDRALRVTSFSDAGVRTAALLASDLDATQRLVKSSLGPLAEDTEQAARLRDTLLAFVSAKGSYVATAEQIHVHKNTVKYRVDQAIEVRGRPLDEERLDLELALVACRWLGDRVLGRGTG